MAGGHLNEGSVGGADDLMYQGSQRWTCSTLAASPALSRCKLDPGHRNYFQTGGAVDLAKSGFLTPTPASPQLPPGW